MHLALLITTVIQGSDIREKMKIFENYVLNLCFKQPQIGQYIYLQVKILFKPTCPKYKYFPLWKQKDKETQYILNNICLVLSLI